MQAVKLGRGAPIASVERVAAAEEDRGRNRRALQLGELHDDCAGECCRDRAEELRIEIVLVAAHLEGAGRKSEHDVPQPRVHFLAGQRAELNAVLLHTAALAQGLLALVGAERREKGVEARVAAVVPVELAILAPEVLARTERRAIGIGYEQDVSGRHLLTARVLDQCRCQPFTRGLGFRQQARAGCRREGCHADELRVIAQARLRVRARPAPIEHELAPRIALAVERERCFDFAGGRLQEQVARDPASAGADASGALERQQEFVTHERIAARLQRIPMLSWNAVDRVDDAQRHFSACSQRRAGPDICPHRALPCSRCRRR
jgi:hypothetical protein